MVYSLKTSLNKLVRLVKKSKRKILYGYHTLLFWD
jgi:hypothetical protein